MVITFNKREIQEFYNFNVSQSKLPRLFAIEEEYMNSMLPLVAWCDFKKLRSAGSKQTLTEQRLESPTKGCWTVVNLGEHKEVYTAAFKPALPGLAIISMEEFNDMVRFEDVPEITSEDVDFWIKSEKLKI